MVDANSDVMPIMLLANDTKLRADGLLGDPTETALTQFGLDKGINVADF